MCFHQVVVKKTPATQGKETSSTKITQTSNLESQLQVKTLGKDTSNLLKEIRGIIKATNSSKRRSHRFCGHLNRIRIHQIFTRWRRISTQQSRPLPGVLRSKRHMLITDWRVKTTWVSLKRVLHHTTEKIDPKQVQGVSLPSSTPATHQEENHKSHSSDW